MKNTVYKSELKLRNGGNSVDVVYSFRGYDEAMAFKSVVDSVMTGMTDYIGKAQAEDRWCRKHGCEELK